MRELIVVRDPDNPEHKGIQLEWPLNIINGDHYHHLKSSESKSWRGEW